MADEQQHASPDLSGVTATTSGKSTSVEFAPRGNTWEATPEKGASEETTKAPEQEQTRPEEPKKILGKFNSQADLERAYQELEKEFSKQRQQAAAPKPQTPQAPEQKTPEQPQQEADPAEDPQQSNDQAEQEGEIPWIDVAAYEKEFDTNGFLSEESYKVLAEKHHAPRELVDEVIAGRVNRRDAFAARLHDAVGGADQLQSVLDWAGKNLSASEIDAFNTAKPEAQLGLLKGYRAAYEQANPQDPARVIEGGTQTSSSPAGGYADEADFRADLRSERYKKDPAFRDRVNRRLAASPWLNN